MRTPSSSLFRVPELSPPLLSHLPPPPPPSPATQIDDFGWANVGYHRPAGFNETQTPNMDSLVASGVLFDQYYAHQYCSPSRSSYQTGRMPIHVNVLNDDEAVWNPADPVSGFAAVPRNMTGIASKLKQAGYATALFGKVRTPQPWFFRDCATILCPPASPTAPAPRLCSGTAAWRRPITRPRAAATTGAAQAMR